MGQQDVSNILQGIALGQRNRQAAADLTQRQQAEQDALAQHEDELNERKRQFDVTSKAVSALHAMKLLEEKQQFAQQIASSGVGGPGVSVTADPENTNQNNVALPNNSDGTPGDSFNVPTPAAYAQQQGQNDLLTKGPLMDKMQQAKIQDLLTQGEMQVRSHQIQMDSAMQTAKIRAAATLSAAEARAAATRYSADKRLQSVGQQSQLDLTPILTQMANGGSTLDDLKKMYPDKKTFATIMNAANSANIKPLDKDQASVLSAYQGIADTLPKMQQFINGQSDNNFLGTGLNIGGPMQAATNADQRRLKNEITAHLGGMTRSLGGIGNNRLNLPELKLAEGGFIPQFTDAKSVNAQRYNDLIDTLHKAIDARLVGVPDSQKNFIKQQIGLDKVQTFGTKQMGITQNPLEKFLRANPTANVATEQEPEGDDEQ